MTPPFSTKLTDAIAHVESSFGKHMRSSDGKHAGWHHMGRAAWADVSKYRGMGSTTNWPYEACTNYQVSTAYCKQYLAILHGQLAAKLERPPTLDEVLCAYRAGLTRFRELNYKTHYYKRYCDAVKKYYEK